MKYIVHIFLGSMLLTLTGCMIPMSPVTLEDRPVVLAKDTTKTLRVIDGMVFSDAMIGSRGVRFPGGTYTLEAEDEVYLYFASPEPVEYRVFKGGKPVDSRFIPGGIALAKKTLRMVPAAGYMNGEEGKKTLIWKLGSEFLTLEGRHWTKSF